MSDFETHPVGTGQRLLDAAAERDALAADADKWQRAALTLQGDRDALRAKLAAAEDALNDAILYENEARDALARQTPVLLAAEAALARVRELHRESRGSMSALYSNPICECGKDYPCPTIRALDATQTGGES